MSSLLRSTKFVRYFTGAARTLILNSAKTAEGNLLINSKALSAANNVLLRDFATSKKPESLEPLLQKLDLEVRRFGRITKKDIDEVFDEIRSKNDITSSQSLLVIRCCGELVPEELPEQRTLLVQKIWGVLTERGIPMDISHYNALLRVYIENEHPFSPAMFLEELEKKGLQPNRVTYQRLMWRYCQEGDVEGATRVLEKMRELNMPVSEPVLNALVMGHAFHGDTEGAKAVLETMAGAGLEPTNRTYTLLACGYAKEGDIDGIEKTIKMAKDKEDVLTDKDIMDIVEHLAVSGHGDKVDQLFPHLQKSAGYNQDACNLILRLLNKGQDKTAKMVMKTMPKSPNTEDTIFKGAFFVKQLLRLNKPVEDVIKTCRELQSEGLIPNAIYIATEAALANGQSELAQKLFSELKKEGVEIRQHYYWPLLVQKGKENDEEGMLQMLRDMASNNMPPTGEALRDYVIPFLIKNDTPQNVILKLQIANVPIIYSARNVMVELLEVGNIRKAAEIALQYRPWGNYALVARSLITALSKTKDIDSFVSILHVISSKGRSSQLEEDSVNDDSLSEDNNVIAEVSRIVKTAIKNLNKPDSCEKLLQGIYDKGLRINTEAAEMLEQYLGESMTTNLSQLLFKLTSSELDVAPIEGPRRVDVGELTTAQMEAQYASLKNKGNTNLTRLQKQLLLAYIKENNLKKLNTHIEELKASNFEITTPTLAQLFEFYCENDEIQKAEECKTEIEKRSPNFLLNKYKLVLMAYALVRANRIDEAIEYLKKHKQTDVADASGFMVNSKCWQMLNTLAEQKNDEKVTELTNTLISCNYIEPSNIILGPSIKVHLLKEDIDSALKTFEHFCKQYRSTPWKGELMKALILKEDATKLQWLADLSTQVHGEVNILHDLVLAFIECGRLRQARRILETPGLQTRNRRLEDACQRYVDEGKSEYLEGLLEATKELSHIDRSNIFYHLLVTYCKADETDKALGLWTVLQEDGEVPSEQFLKYLGQHLKSKNRQVPFVIPEDKSVKTINPKNVVEKIVTKKELTKPTKNDVSINIETLTKNGDLSQATDFAIKSIDHGVIPKSNVLKFLLKSLAEGGHVEKIQQLGKQINESLKRRVTYNDKLTLAIFARGAGSQHIDNLMESVQAAKTDEDLENALKHFPRSNALATVVQDEKLVDKCTQIAEIAASRGYILPINLLWMELLLCGKEKESNAIWTKWLSTAPTVVFRRLLQESHLRKEPQLIEKLINLLKTSSPISNGSLVDSLKRGGRFYLCWVADSWPLRFATITHRQLWSQDIRIICDDLVEVIMNESGRPTQRFSLRLSSQLLRGLVRLYQKKVNVFLGELCRLNANVIKSANKKWNTQEVEIVRRIKRPLPQLNFQDAQGAPENEQRIVEMIQASGNAVSNIEDITLREPTIVSEMLLRPNDGFGEEHPEQSSEQLQDRTVEQMLVRADVSAQRSGLELPLDLTDASHDRTRLLLPHVRMERMSDHDLTVFTKSNAEESVPEFEKDIPEIPEIPPPELPVPVPEKSRDEVLGEEHRVIPVESSKEPEQVEIELEEIQAEPQSRKRRLRHRLMVDKKIKISTQFFRTRLENPRVELRCQDSSDDIILIRVPPEFYFRRPCHGGEGVTSNLGFVISRLFARNLGVINNQPLEDREIERVMQRSNYCGTRSLLERIEEEQEVPIVVERPQVDLEQIQVEEIAMEQNVPEATRPSVGAQLDVDIADMLTQKIETLSQARKRKEQDALATTTPKRQRSVGYVSFRESQVARLTRQDASSEADKENIPANILPRTTFSDEPRPAQNAEKIVSSMLQEAGLADIQIASSVVVETGPQVSQRAVSISKPGRGNLSDSSETPLGSLDRTKVSLGDSEQTTDSKRFIRDQWGTEGTMLKILTLVKSGRKPVTVSTLVKKGPTIAGYTRVIAARCFTSILKLKQHGFINTSKDPGTLEINAITLGEKLTSSQEQN
ncbi:unnamed protein product [Arctia plantaginis]|uniref:Rad21/Rec8-like protein N-terminal domain-containing protein n=1 Tax=Arctia plantaginis TaxID=874455 RepID=A0A8S0YU38_ARCPL|nr:unnamed protein product [Arctia plantaginis]